ncbi:YhgE/Pip family protein [Lacticaseibacillus saniviri]
MLKDEFKFIGKNRLILLSVLVIMLIPFLYSIFFLKSVWDPYGDTKELPVAVVNNDHAVEYNGRRMNVGKDLVKKLKTNDQLGWKFVTESQAKKGLKDNKYYTVVTIPDNFSSHAATVLNDKPKKMQLTYETNDSLNYLSQVISGIGVDKLASEIRASVTNAYASAMFDQMKVLGSGMSKAATGANQVGDGLVTLDDGLNQYTAGVSQVNDGVQTMAVSVSPLSSGVKKLDDGSSQVASGVKQYTDGTDKVASGLSQLNGQTGELKSGVSQLSTGASQVATGVNQYTTGTDKIAAGLSVLNSKTGVLQNGVGTLAAGSTSLTSNLGQYTTGVSAYANGVSQVTDGISTLNSKTGDLQSGIGQLADGSSVLSTKTGELQSGVNKLATGAEQLNAALEASADPSQQAQINQLLAGLPQINSGIQQLNQALQTQVPSMPAIDTTALNNSIASIDANAANLQSGLGTASAALQTAQTAVTNGTSTQAATTAGVNSSTLASEISNAIKAKYPNVDASNISAIVEQAVGTTTTTTAPQATNTALNSALADIQTGLQIAGGAATNLNSNLTTVKNALPSATTLEQLSGLSTSLDQLKQQVAVLASSSSVALPGAVQAISTLNSGLQQVSGGVGQLSTGLSAINGQMPTFVLGVNQLSAGLGQVNTQMPTLVSGISQLNAGGQQLAAKTGTITAAGSKLTAGSSQISNGLGQLNGQVPTLVSGVSQLNTGAQQLTANSSQLNSGASQVSNGLGKLNGQVPALVSGVSQLNNGTQQLTAKSGKLNDGATQVSDGLTTLNNKIPALTDGVDKLSAGTSELNDKSGQLKDGSSKLKDGSKQLATSLDSGAKQVNGIKLTKATADMFSAPTKTTHKNYTYVPNYGHALAPYVLSLALYVGALVFNFAYPIRKVSKKDGTATQWFFSKIVLGGLVAVGMAIVEGGLMQVGGLTVAHQGQFFLFAILFALASMYLVMFLSMLLDNPGRFIAMVLLMLQLGGSGGTFPMEITNGFYNAIHPFLPMTYSILGFRNAITSGISGSSIATSIGFLIAVILISLVLLWLSMQFLQRRHLMGVSQLDDNQKLQEVEK